MAKNKLTDLRDHLFEQLERLKDCESDKLAEEVNRAEAIVKLSQAISETAKIEVSYARAVEEMPDGKFFETDAPFLDDPRLKAPIRRRLNGEGRA
jgi:hypothetical protein